VITEQLGQHGRIRGPLQEHLMASGTSPTAIRLTTRWSRPGQLRRIGSKIGSKSWPGGSSRGRWAAMASRPKVK